VGDVTTPNGQLDRELSLARAVDPRFVTVRATMRDWARHRRIAEVQGLVSNAEPEEPGERFTRLWVNADRRVREEWDTGAVRQGQSLEDATNWPLLDPGWLTDDPHLTIVGQREVAGRPGIAVEAIAPAGMLLPGSDRCVGVVDRERGLLLRCEAWLGDELLMVEEMTEATFDEPLDPALFRSD
jgi:hypothetical protein